MGLRIGAARVSEGPTAPSGPKARDKKSGALSICLAPRVWEVLESGRANINWFADHGLTDGARVFVAKGQTQFPDGVRLVDNVEANRLQIFFPQIPAEALRRELKQHGFLLKLH